jgi:hypothetical protein
VAPQAISWQCGSKTTFAIEWIVLPRSPPPLQSWASSLLGGGVVGYVLYDTTHWALHSGRCACLDGCGHQPQLLCVHGIQLVAARACTDTALLLLHGVVALRCHPLAIW